MAFKMKGFSGFKASPAKQKVDPDAPGTPGTPGYEPPVKRSDLDAKGKAIYDAHRAKKKGTGVIMDAEEIKRMNESKRKYVEKKKKSPYKNYKNPQDYKVFNMGNKPTPMKAHEAGHKTADPRAEEASMEEKKIIKKMDKLNEKLKELDKDSPKYKKIKDKIMSLDNKLYPFD